MKKIVPEDLYQFRFLSGLNYSPDGRTAAWLVKQADAQANGYTTHIWLRRGEQAPSQLTSAGDETVYCWETVDTILFFDKRAGEEKSRAAAGEDFTPCYRINIHGGEAVKAFELPFRAGELAVLDENWLIALGQIRVDEPDLYLGSAGERSTAAQRRKAESQVKVLDELPFRFNGLGYINKCRTALFVIDRHTGEVRRLSAPQEEVASYTVVNGRLYYAAEPFTGKRLYRQHIFCWEPGSASVQPVYQESTHEITFLAAMGDQLVFAGTTQERYGYNENPMFYQVDLETGKVTLFSDNPDSLHPAIGSDMRLGRTRLAQSHGGAVYYLASHRTSVSLMKLDAQGHRSEVIGEDGTVDDFAINPVTGQILAVGLYDNRPEELFAFAPDGSGRTRVSNFNTSLLADTYVADLEPITYHFGGYDLDGWVLKPYGYDPSKKYAGVLDIHGGPKMAYGPVFYHEMQVWASMGYFVFYCNPIGSDGRGNDFLDMRGKYGTVDYDSLMAFVDAVVEQYPQLDGARLSVTGGSYGGFMTNWIVSHTDRFVCAASQRSISNWLSFYGCSDLGYNFNVDQLAANPFTDPKLMWERSPLKYADKVHTPTLFLQSDEDYRCPISEALQMYTALMDHGVETRLCLFHGENHELSRSGRPAARLRRLQEICRWFEIHCPAEEV